MRQANIFGWLLTLAILAGTAVQGRAQQPTGAEIRTYTVEVDGKQSGTTQVVIAEQKDGTTRVETKANAQVKLLLNYSYNYRGTEVWDKQQLVKLEGQCTDNGRKYNVRAEFDAKENRLRLQANGKEQLVQADVWTTTYWKLPDAKYHNKAVTLLDADRGDLIGGQLKYVETANLNVAGKSQKCYHFQVVGPNPSADLWFDVYHRLVRQEFTDRGHRTVIELTTVQR